MVPAVKAWNMNASSGSGLCPTRIKILSLKSGSSQPRDINAGYLRLPERDRQGPVRGMPPGARGKCAKLSPPHANRKTVRRVTWTTNSARRPRKQLAITPRTDSLLGWARKCLARVPEAALPPGRKTMRVPTAGPRLSGRFWGYGWRTTSAAILGLIVWGVATPISTALAAVGAEPIAG